MAEVYSTYSFPVEIAVTMKISREPRFSENLHKKLQLQSTI